jgi:ABC-2 type transport system permease protein
VTVFIRVAAFHLRQLLRTPFFVQQAVAAPAAFVLFLLFGSWGGDHPLADDTWVSASLAGLWATTTTAVGLIGFQRFQGTLEHLAMSTLRPSVVFGSLCSAAALLGVIAVPVTITLQVVVTWHVAIDLQTLVGLGAGCVACVASASVLASVFVLSRTATVYEPLVLTPPWLLTGIVIPLDAIPRWLTPLSLLHPLTGAVQATRSDDIASALGWCAASLMMSAVSMAVATMLLAAALRRARVAGTLALA